MKIGILMVVSLLSLAGKAASGQGGTLEKVRSKLLDRTVEVALHVPSETSLAKWKATHPGWHPRLAIFLTGAYDGPEDLLKRGVFQHLAAQEEAGLLPPSLWVSPEHYQSWYANRKDGSFPYERFLMEELIPTIEREHPAYGGARDSRTVAGFSMGGFGALNLSARTNAFDRCVALSSALVRPPFKTAGFWIRRTLTRAFPMDMDAFTPWNPWVNLGGKAELVLGCGTNDKYHLDAVTRDFAERCREQGRAPVAVFLTPGDHDWSYWAPAFESLAPWIAGGALPPTLER